MTVRAKFYVEQKSGTKSGNVLLRAVYSDDPTHENKSFWSATPCGEISMWIENPDALAQFNIGDEVYVDFTHAPKDRDINNCQHCGQYHAKLAVREGETLCPVTGRFIP